MPDDASASDRGLRVELHPMDDDQRRVLEREIQRRVEGQ